MFIMCINTKKTFLNVLSYYCTFINPNYEEQLQVTMPIKFKFLRDDLEPIIHGTSPNTINTNNYQLKTENVIVEGKIIFKPLKFQAVFNYANKLNKLNESFINNIKFDSISTSIFNIEFTYKTKEYMIVIENIHKTLKIHITNDEKSIYLIIPMKKIFKFGIISGYKKIIAYQNFLGFSLIFDNLLNLIIKTKFYSLTHYILSCIFTYKNITISIDWDSKDDNIKITFAIKRISITLYIDKQKLSWMIKEINVWIEGLESLNPQVPGIVYGKEGGLQC